MDTPSFFNGGGEMDEIVFRDVLNFADQGRQRGLKLHEGRVLFWPGRARDQGAEFSYPLL